MLVSGVQHSDSVTHTQYPLLFIFFSHIGHYGVLSRVPCAIQLVLTSYLFYIWSEVKSLSHVQLFATPWTVAYQASPSMGFSRQGYWSGFPFPSPGDLPDPAVELGSPALQADALPSEPPGKPLLYSSVYVSTPTSQFVPLPISPSNKFVLYTYDSYFCSVDESIKKNQFHLNSWFAHFW